MNKFMNYIIRITTLPGKFVNKNSEDTGITALKSSRIEPELDNK